MALDDFPRYRETEPGAVGLGREEELEHLRHVVRGDTGAGVGHQYAHAPAVLGQPTREGHPPTSRRRLDGVRDRIEQHVLDLRLVELDFGQSGGQLDHQRDAMGRSQIAQRRHHLADDVVEPAPLRLRLERLGEIEQRRDPGLELVRLGNDVVDVLMEGMVCT